MNPLQIVFRAFATIMAAVFVFDGLFEPNSIEIEDAEEWAVARHDFFSNSQKTILRLESQYGRQVKVDCKAYASLCETVKQSGSNNLVVWVADLGYYKSPSLVKAMAGKNEIVALSEQQAKFESAGGWRNGLRLFFLLVAVYAWREPLLRALGQKSAA